MIKVNGTDRPFLILVFATIFLALFGVISHNAFADTVVSTISVGSYPEDSAVNPVTDKIYVSNNDGGATNGADSVSVINGTSNTIISTIPFGNISSLAGIGVNLNTNKIYVAQNYNQRISVIDGNTNTVVDNIQIGNYPTWVAVDSNTNRIYITAQASLYVIDGSTDKIIQTMNACGIISKIAVNVNTNEIYVACNAEAYNNYPAVHEVQIINGSTDTVQATTNFSNSAPGWLAVNPNTNTVYAALSNSTISLIDGNTGVVIGKITGISPGDLAINPNTNKLYAANGNSNTVSVINTVNNQLIETLTVGTYPDGLSVNPDTNRIYVINTHDWTVSVIDGSSSNTSTIPSSPQNLAATAGNAQVSLAWTAPSSNGGSAITGYNVYRGTSSGTETLLTSVSASTTSYADSTVTNGQTYFYKVTAVNSVGESAPSNEASATPTAPTTVPSAPTGLTAATVSSSQINLSWTAPANNGGSTIAGYLIERSNNTGSTWSTVANTGSTVTTYNDTGLVPSTAYTYRVSAINSAGTSSPSNTASATTSATAPPPTGITLNNIQKTSGTVSSSPYQLTLANFNAGTGSNNLLVVGVSANNNVVASVTFGGVHLSKKASSFSNNDAEFWYLANPSGTGNIVVTMGGSTSAVVGAYSFSGVDQTTPIPTSTTNHNTAASSPTVSITTKNPNSLVLDLPSIYGGVTLGSPTCTQQWDANMPSAITGASSSKVVQSPGSVTCSWTASGGGDMWDDVAVEVKASTTTSSTTTTVPQPPTGLTATTISSSQINLSWTAPSSNGGSPITGYKIERSTDSGTTWFTVQSNTASATTTYSDTGLNSSTAYVYRVSAINGVGTSSPSNTASATTSSAPTTTTQVTISVKSVNLSGNPITGMSVVIRYTNGTTISDTFTPASFTVTSGTTYVVHVRNYGTNVFSHWQDGTTNSYYTITPTQNIALTAYYSTG